jgi:hypothetical protein
MKKDGWENILERESHAIDLFSLVFSVRRREGAIPEGTTFSCMAD